MGKYDIRVLFLTFIFYSFIGWLNEIIQSIILEKKFVNRGFFIGPWIPIYGVGAILLTIITRNFTNKPIFLIIFSSVLFSILEYSVSYFLEKYFNARWWDYSERKYNLNGRICLFSILSFTIAGTFMIYVINPFIIDKITDINVTLASIISGILFLLFFTDVIVSIIVIFSIRKTANNLRDDDTEEISKRVKDILLGKNYFNRRYVNAYPNFYIK